MNSTDREKEKNKKTAPLLISALLILVTAACLLDLLFLSNAGGSYVAEIYRDGLLIEEIPLDQVREPYTFSVEGEDGRTNRVELRPGSIGVVWADCPDKLCVRQGFAETSVIPITCLPNRLVIRLVPADSRTSVSSEPDAVTY